MTPMQRIRNHPLVEEVSDERRNGDGIWAYIKPGHHDGYDALCPTHAVHEDTPTEVLARLRGCEPCECADCKILRK